jgi:proline dehydrogenase
MIEEKINIQDTNVGFKSKSDVELRNMKWLFILFSQPILVILGANLTLFLLRIRFPFVSYIVRKTIFNQFCGGRTLLEADNNITALSNYNIASVLDYGAEGKESIEEYNKTMNESLKAIEFASSHKSIPFVSTKITGLCSHELLIKLSAGEVIDESLQEERNNLMKRIDAICHKACHLGVGLFIDAEESWIQKAIDDVCQLMMERYNKESAIVYNTFQLYRKDRFMFLKDSHLRAKNGGYFLGAKLVRGAYMEKETLRARKMGYENPIQNNKMNTDRDYNLALEYCLDNINEIGCCTATHNELSCLLQAKLMQEKSIPFNHPHLLFCQLYGMSDTLTFNLAENKFNTAKYMPYGPIKDVIPYLIRRAEENSSVGGEMGRELSFIKKEIKRRKKTKSAGTL